MHERGRSRLHFLGLTEFTTFYLFLPPIDTSLLGFEYVVDGNHTMNLKRRWNERTRLMLTLELAVVLPAAALVILSVLHLKGIQRDRGVQAAFQRDFSHVLKISEKQFNQKAYDLADDVRLEVPSSSAACASTLDRVLAAHPYIGHLFVFDPSTGLVFRSQPNRAKEPAFHEEAE